MLEFLLGKLGAAIAWLGSAVFLASTLLLSLSLAHTRSELETLRSSYATVKSSLDLQAATQKAKDAAYDRAVAAIQPTILHDKQVIQTIRETAPGPDLCASAHQLISNTFKQEQLP